MLHITVILNTSKNWFWSGYIGLTLNESVNYVFIFNILTQNTRLIEEIMITIMVKHKIKPSHYCNQ